MPYSKFGTVYLVENRDMKLSNIGNIHTTLDDKESYQGIPRQYSTVITDMKYDKNPEFLHIFDFMGRKIEYTGCGWTRVYSRDNYSLHCAFIVTWEQAKGFLFVRNDDGDISYLTLIVDMFDPKWGFCYGHSLGFSRWCEDKSKKIDYEEIKDCYRSAFAMQVRDHDQYGADYLNIDELEFMDSAMDEFDERFAE